MKTTGFLMVLFSLAAFSARSQPVVGMTNRVVTFTNLQGRVYENVQLVRADTNGVIYLSDSGGGSIAYTNLSGRTLTELGVPQRVIAAGENQEQRADQIEARDRERMADAANWQRVHLTAVEQSPKTGGLVWTLREMAGPVVISPVPSKALNYFRSYYAAAAAVNQAQLQINQTTQQVAALRAQVNRYRGQVNAEEAQLQKADQATDPATGSSQLDAWYNAVLPQRVQISQWTARIKDEKQRLSTMEGQLNDLEGRQESLEKQLQTAEDRLHKLLDQGKSATEIRVFVTSKKYYGCPLLAGGPS